MSDEGPTAPQPAEQPAEQPPQQPGQDPGLEPWLREILRCPSCRSELRDAIGPHGGAELVCTNEACALAYRVDDGIPVMLVDEARSTRA